MPATTSRTHTVALGDLVAAIFDQARELTPAIADDVATLVVADVLRRTANRRALRVLQTRR
jgi:hypothetical protein